MKKERMEIIKSIDEYDVVLTTYGSLRNDLDYYEEIDFDYCIIDEAQNIKNPLASASDAVKAIIKDINNVDVNVVFRLVESIKCEYDKPIMEERRKKIISSIGFDSIENLKNNKLCNKDD